MQSAEQRVLDSLSSTQQWDELSAKMAAEEPPPPPCGTAVVLTYLGIASALYSASVMLQETQHIVKLCAVCIVCAVCRVCIMFQLITVRKIGGRDGRRREERMARGWFRR